MTDTPIPPVLPPALNDFTRSLSRNPALLQDLVTAYGSPLNVITPHVAAENAQAFAEVIERHQLRGQVYYAHKANRSSAFVRHLATTSTKLDVASLGELQHGLGQGFEPQDIMVTGPKTDELLWLAARVGAIVNCDSLAEVSRLRHLVESSQLPICEVLIRISGFSRPGTVALARQSRFGEDISKLPQIAETFSGCSFLRLIGVSFHLDTIAVSEKVTAFEQCIDAISYLQARGIPVEVLDCGGGYGVTYVESKEAWHEFTEALSAAVRGARPPVTWNRHAYGLRLEGGVVRGSINLYPADRDDTGPAYLEECLNSETVKGPTVAETLRDHLIELWVEPGRALLAQAGFTLARVANVRDSSVGILVGCEINARDVSLEEHGVAVDPILLSADARTDSEVGVYLLGNLCLEADMISKRLIRLPRRPHPNDVLLFANTAGYFMDFSADRALFQPTASTVCLIPTTSPGNNRVRWCEDSQYWPHRFTPPQGKA